MILIMYSNFPPSPEHLVRLREIAGNMPLHVVQSEAAALELAPEAEIILGHRYLWQTLARAERIRWVQSTAGGMETIVTPQLRQRAPLLTRSTLSGDVIAFHAFSMAAALIRRLPECLANERHARLARPADLLPMPRNVLVLGLGEIGQAISRMMRSLGMHVVGAARASSPAKESACDHLALGSAWRDHLAETDILFVSLPLDERTKGIMDSRLFRALPSHAVIVNVGRGDLIDWPAASEALSNDSLGGLAVDAIDHLPDALDPIWRSPKFLLTPKMAALHPGFQAALEKFIESQVARYFHGEPLMNAVDYMKSAP